MSNLTIFPERRRSRQIIRAQRRESWRRLNVRSITILRLVAGAALALMAAVAQDAFGAHKSAMFLAMLAFVPLTFVFISWYETGEF